MRKIIICSIITAIGLIAYMPQITLAESTPSISAITNSINSVNDTVTITGQGLNFSSTLPGYGQDNPSQNTLYCNGTNMWEKIINWTDTSIQFTFGSTSFFTSGNKTTCYISFQGFYAPGESTDTNYNSNSVEVTLIPACTAWTYTDWSTCSESGQQTRSVLTSSPTSCTGGSPVLTQSCTYIPPESPDAQGSFDLIIPTGRDQGVLHNDKIKIDYYGSDIITEVYLNSTKVTLGVEQFSIISSLVNHQVVYFYPPTNSTSGDLTVHMTSGKTKNVGYLEIFEDTPSTVTPTTTTETETDNSPVVTTANDTDGDGVPNNTDYYPNTKSQVIVKNYSFNYKMLGDNHGEEVNFTIEIPKDLYLFYQKQNHTFSDGYQNITSFITEDDIVIKSIIDQVNTLYEEKGLNPIALIYQLSGEIIWTDDVFSIKGWDEYPKYPIETLVDGLGDCEDTVFLLAALFKAYGVEPVLVRFDNHLGLATVVDQDILDLIIYKYGKDFMATANSQLTNAKLIYFETTGNTNWDFAFMPEELQDKSYTVHAIGEYERTTGTLQQEAKAFSDVPTAHQNAIAIKYLKANGIIGGYPDGTFKPENPVNRGELMKILVEGKIGKPDENLYKNCFPDVTTQWFAPYVCYAKSEGWVEGYPDGNFKPEQTVNKVEALKMLINSQDIATAETITYKPFSDVNTTDWFAKYVSKAKSMNILEETGSTFSPGDGMKRAGISENLYRILIQ